MEADSNLQQYKVIPQSTNTYGITPSSDPQNSNEPVLNILPEGIPKQDFFQTALLASFYGIFTIFIACIYCKLDEIIKPNTPWAYLLIPFTLSLVPLFLYIYYFVKGQIGVVTASFFCMKSTIIGIFLTCFILQAYFLLLKADNTLTLSYTVLFIPTYFCLIAPTIFFAIISPLCFRCQQPFLYFGTMLFAYLLASCITLYFLVRRLDYTNLEIPPRYVFYPFWAVCALHIGAGFTKMQTRVWTIVFLGFMVFYTGAECLRQEDIIGFPWWIMTLLFGAAFAVPIFFLIG